MTMKAILKRYCKIIMTFVTTRETLIKILSKSSKLKKDFAPPIIGTILKGKNNTCNVRNFQEFERERKSTVCFGLETISYRSPQLWSPLPEHMRQLNSIDQFKRSVRQWVCNTCPCTFCVEYIYKISDFCKSSIKSLTWQGISN